MKSNSNFIAAKRICFTLILVVYFLRGNNLEKEIYIYSKKLHLYKPNAPSSQLDIVLSIQSCICNIGAQSFKACIPLKLAYG